MMHLKVFFLWASFGCIFFVSCQDKNISTKAIVDSSNIFTEDIYQEILSTKQFNSFVVSPFSLGNVLAMLKAGANGTTASELATGLHLENVADSDVHDGYADLTLQLQDNKDVIIETGNRIFTAQRFPLKESYLNVLKEKYYSGADTTDFSMSKEAAEKINKFVASATHDKIKDIVDEGSLDADTVAVLVNTIYFKGLWKTRFNLEDTVKTNFTTLKGEQIEVDTMKTSDKFYYNKIEDLKSEVIALPYKGDRFSLVIILPEENTTITEIEPLLTNSTLSSLPSRLTLTDVLVKLPRFKLESEVDFVKTGILHNLGMKEILKPTAELKGMTDVDGVFLSKVLQKAFIEVNEEGTEAAAATVAIPQRISFKRVAKFEVNRPFIAYIFDEKTKAVLFVVRKVD